MISVERFIFNELSVNSFVLYDETGECIIVDPGCNSKDQQEQLTRFILDKKLTPVFIVNTHGHFDHIFGNIWAKEEFGCPVLAHKEDEPIMEHADKYAGLFGFTFGKSPLPDGYLNENEDLKFGVSLMNVLHVPGHSPGSICLYSATDRILICGDVLFNGSIGRTDLFGGNYDQLIGGIKSKLMTLPADTVVWPGHGPETTIGREHDSNPFLN